MLRGVREMDNTLSDDTIAGQNAAEGIRRKRYSQEGVRRRTRMFMGDSIVRKTDRVLNKGDDVVVCFTGIKIQAITHRAGELWVRTREVLF